MSIPSTFRPATQAAVHFCHVVQDSMEALVEAAQDPANAERINSRIKAALTQANTDRLVDLYLHLCNPAWIEAAGSVTVSKVALQRMRKAHNWQPSKSCGAGYLMLGHSLASGEWAAYSGKVFALDGSHGRIHGKHMNKAARQAHVARHAGQIFYETVDKEQDPMRVMPLIMYKASLQLTWVFQNIFEALGLHYLGMYHPELSLFNTRNLRAYGIVRFDFDFVPCNIKCPLTEGGSGSLVAEVAQYAQQTGDTRSLDHVRISQLKELKRHDHQCANPNCGTADCPTGWHLDRTDSARRVCSPCSSWQRDHDNEWRPLVHCQRSNDRVAWEVAFPLKVCNDCGCRDARGHDLARASQAGTLDNQGGPTLTGWLCHPCHGVVKNSNGQKRRRETLASRAPRVRSELPCANEFFRMPKVGTAGGE
ncbi:hypothetical protein FH972_024216 [Carpinus fangiana]|uniref:Uncharacterized protein n=1 Tax=Carpinus fangiana TaxID=176857 RepID=A0A5N6KZX3_9ROSI|nr:hypothetical protein FH972_024216 [Carpinus fangiana]